MRKLSILLLLIIAWPVYSATRYFDARDFTLLGRSVSDTVTASGFSRIDMSRYPPQKDVISRYGGFSTGMALLFETDSPYIKARWHNRYPTSGLNTTPLMQSGLDLYIERDGEWIHAGVGLPTDSLSAERTLVEKMDGTMHRCLLYLPLWNRIEDLSIGISSSATIRPGAERPRRKIAFVGSSITHGASASRPGRAFPAIIGRETGVEAINLGFAGVCKLDDFFAELIIGTDADLFVIDAFSNPSAAQIRGRLRGFVKKIREAKPDIPLVFLQTLVRETGNFNLEKRNEEKWKRRAAEEEMKKVMADYPGILFINPGMPLGDTHDRTVDGVHPTDAGFDFITQRLCAILNEEF